jgi:hypothetical protein
MKLMVLFLGLTPFIALSSLGHCDDILSKNIAGSISGTTKISTLDVPLCQILVTQKPNYVHILWDAFPERAAIQAAGKSFSLKKAVLDLVLGPGLAAVPSSKTMKIDVTEFPERDDYGAPRWDKIQFLGRFEAKLVSGKWSIRKLPQNH